MSYYSNFAIDHPHLVRKPAPSPARVVAELIAEAAREALLDSLEFLAAMTGHEAYGRALADVRAGAAWEDLGGGWVSVQRPGGAAHLAHKDACDCRARVLCRHRALAHGVAFTMQLADEEAAGTERRAA